MNAARQLARWGLAPNHIVDRCGVCTVGIEIDLGAVVKAKIAVKALERAQAGCCVRRRGRWVLIGIKVQGTHCEAVAKLMRALCTALRVVAYPPQSVCLNAALEPSWAFAFR